MSKPQEILELEKMYGITLRETKRKADIMGWSKSNLYFLKDGQKVIGLNLNENKISNIQGLEVFTSLKFLSFHDNQITKIENLENLTNLSELSIYNNQITKIENLEKLTNLSELNLSKNQILKIENLERLTNLSTLHLSKNQITKIENLEKLTNLSNLYINNNQISKIENLENLINLSILNSSNNQISKIENLEKSTNLSRLNISSNQITEINFLKFVSKLPKLKYLSVKYNPFVVSDKLILKVGENHLDIIKSELQKLEETQIKVQLPVKVMLLGNHASGKSTILTYLQTQQCSKVDPSQTNSTHVLSVIHSQKEINHKLPKAIFYDFGGQDYYHGIYRVFFTQEAINLLVWNPKSDCNELLENDSNNYPVRNYNLRYWLEQLHYILSRRSQKQQQNHDPLLLIQTFADVYPRKKNFQDIDLIPNLVDQFHISLNIDFKSSKNDTALKHITAVFWDTIQQQTDEREVPEWFPIFLHYILTEAEKDAISLDTIITYYKRENISKEEKRMYLKEDLEQLSRKGLLLYYKNDTAINDVAWLNPSKTVSDIHNTILNKEIIKEQGRLSRKAFQELHIDYKIERLLLNEKILFFDNGYQEYIIPNYLPLALENDYSYVLQKYGFDTPAFTLKFEYFIPFGFINQLICYYGQNPDIKQYWRNQLIFTFDKEFKVWIRLNFSQLTIAVFIQSNNEKDEKLNNAIQELFYGILLLYWGKDISRPFRSLSNPLQKFKQYREMFSETLKPKDLYISVDEEYFVNYNDLDDPKKTKDNIISYKLPKNENDVNKDDYKLQPSHIYRNFTDNENIQKESEKVSSKKMKKIFISYSNKDINFKKELEDFLKPLQKFQLAKTWSGEELKSGLWDSQVQKELESSDIVVFLMSMNFAASDYILKDEVYKTFEYMAKNPNKKIVCVLVKHFPWRYFASLKDIFNIKDEINDEDKAGFALANLPNYQFLPYYHDETKDKRYLRPIAEWEYKERAYSQIVEALGMLM